jgi:hypothetical protein
MIIIGTNIRDRKPETAKILYILAAVYVIIGLGICGTMIGGF